MTDPRTPPADCTTMAEVRQGVDALDRALVLLLAERQGYMDACSPHQGRPASRARRSAH
jgi:isochorismate pyruvate lyase